MNCTLCNGSGERKTKRSGTVLACADCAGTGQSSRYEELKAHADALADALEPFARANPGVGAWTVNDDADEALDAYRKWLEEGK